MSDEEYEKVRLDVISIDPEGCKDVDDAFRFFNLLNKQNFFIRSLYYEPFDIYGWWLFELMKQRFFTIYYDGEKPYALIYTEELSSLREVKKDGLIG